MMKWEQEQIDRMLCLLSAFVLDFFLADSDKICDTTAPSVSASEGTHIVAAAR